MATAPPKKEYGYAEIEADALQLVQRSKKPLPPHAKQVMAALWQYQSRLPVIERCPYCSELMRVDMHGETAWVVVCPCGKVKETFRGI